VAVWRGEPDGGPGRRQPLLAAAFVVAGVVLAALGQESQHSIAGGIRASVLRPFLIVQDEVALARTRAGDMDAMRARLDSLAAVVHGQGTLAEENAALRVLLALSERLGPTYRSATVLRPGTAGSESTFLLDVGTRQGVVAGAPILGQNGLVGAVLDAGTVSAVGMDWTHPDFRASAMVADPEVYGIVQNWRGAFREEDRLVLTGTAFNEAIPDGTAVVTSGLGGVYPRGIPIGIVDGIADVQGSWRKSYWLRPAVLPGSVTHVLVAVEEVGPDGVTWPEPEASLADSSVSERPDAPALGPADLTGGR